MSTLAAVLRCGIQGPVVSENDKRPKGGPRQLSLPLHAANDPAPRRSLAAPSPRAFRVIRGEGKRRREPLESRDDVAQLLVGSACDLLLKRISPDRAHEIQTRVDRVMRLFDRIGSDPVATALLRRELDDLEQLCRARGS